MHPADTLQVYADGSFNAGSFTGAWAFVVLEGDERIQAERGTGEGSSNNAFEVLAVLNAMSWLEASAAGRRATVWTDSRHVVEGVDHWRMIWRGNGWKRVNPNPRARRREIPDAVYWRRLDASLDRNPHVTVRWCKAHAGNAGNEFADALAAGKTLVSERAGGREIIAIQRHMRRGQHLSARRFCNVAGLPHHSVNKADQRRDADRL